MVSRSIYFAKASRVTKFNINGIVKYTSLTRVHWKVTWQKSSEELKVCIASKGIDLVFSGNLLEAIL